MNGFALAAGILTVLAFGAHAFVGAREFKLFAPSALAETPRTAWVQALCGWHWVSVDLLVAGAALLAVALTAWWPDERTLLLLVSGYFGLTGMVWLGTLVTAGREVPNRYLVLGQWIFCWIVAGLAWLAQ